MPKYWLIDNELPETPELPSGYYSGIIDDSNPAPKGAMEFNNKNQLNKVVNAIEKRDKSKVEKESKRQNEKKK